MAQQPYCSEYDVVQILSQAGVDLRQDDLPGVYGLFSQTTTSGTFTMPGVNGSVNIPVFNGLWTWPTQTIFVQDAGFFFVVAPSVGQITALNLSWSGNAQAGTSLASGRGVSLSPLAEYIDRAALEIDEHCLLFYTPAGLLGSTWITKHAAITAAYYYCMRRGNLPPAGVALLFEGSNAARGKDGTRNKLERVQKGTLNIPDLPRRKPSVPVMSNMRPALRPHPHMVVERYRSTGRPEQYHQNGDPYDLTGINQPFMYDFYI